MYKKQLVEKFGNSYNYDSLPEKFPNQTMLLLTCKVHGEFKIRADSHLRSLTGCPNCSYLKRTFSKEDIIKKANAVHNNKYSYDKLDYKNMNTKVIITCPIHGDFTQTPAKHIFDKQGCPNCGHEIPPGNHFSNIKYTNMLQQHLPNIVLLQDYYRLKNKITVKCNDCNNTFSNFTAEYWITTKSCPYCYIKRKDTNIREGLSSLLSSEYEIIEKDIIKSENTVISIKHACGGVVSRKASVFLKNGFKCPICYPYESKGSRKITEYLTKNKYVFEKEKIFPDLFDKNVLRYDFYIPSINILIEFDGIQHFKPTFGSKEHRKINFELTRKHDLMKNEYALSHNIKLIRIKYTDLERIETILERELVA